MPSKNVLICKETICSLDISYSEDSLEKLKHIKSCIEENKNIDSVYLEKFKDNSQLVELIKKDNLTKDENSKKEITGFIDQCIKTSELIKEIYGINEKKNDDILDSIFYKNGGKICMITGIECADHILEKKEDVMKELREKDPFYLFIDENKDLINEVEKELEFYFLYNMNKGSNKNLDILTFVSSQSNNIEVPEIVNLVLNDDRFLKISSITKAVICKNYDKLPLFKFLDELYKKIPDNLDSKFNLEEEVINTSMEVHRMKDNKIGLSSEFITLIQQLKVEEKFIFFDEKEGKYLASPILKGLFFKRFKSNEIYKKIFKWFAGELSQSSSPIYHDSINYNISDSNRGLKPKSIEVLYKEIYGTEIIYNEQTENKDQIKEKIKEQFNNYIEDINFIKKITKGISFNMDTDFNFYDIETRYIMIYSLYEIETLQNYFNFHNMYLPILVKEYKEGQGQGYT